MFLSQLASLISHIWIRKARVAKLFSLFCLSFFCLSGCERGSGFETVAFSGATMGTTYNIKVIVQPEQKTIAERTQPVIDEQLKAFNQSLSTYISDSEIMKINAAPKNEWLEVSSRFLSVLILSQTISGLSGGAFDATVGPLVNAWGFGPDWTQSQTPTEATLQEVMANVGYQSIEIDKPLSRIRKLKDVQLDFSAIAKGYAVDEIADYLWDQGMHHFMVEIGGELRLHGHNVQGQAWRIGVESPQEGGKIRPIGLSEAGLATSGDYRNYYEKNGMRFSHTIDPSTGKPITHNLASITVVADTAAKADALATAFSVMGGDEALRLANTQGVAVYLIERSGDAFTTRHNDYFLPYLEAGK